jgi:hypothetical protein
MVLVRRLGGWRPTEESVGTGRVRLKDGGAVESVRYTFTVWHQLSQGFHGPYRAEGRLLGLPAEEIEPLIAQDVVLELEDGRFLPARILPFGRLLAHTAPDEADPWVDPYV